VAGEAVKFALDERHQAIECTRIAAAPGQQECRGRREIRRNALILPPVAKPAIFDERQVRSRFQIIVDVGMQDPSQAALVRDDAVIETLAAKGPDQPLRIGILPGECAAVITCAMPFSVTLSET